MSAPTGEPGRIVRATWEIRPNDGGPAIRGDLRALEGPPPATAVVLCHGFKGFRRWGFFPGLARTLARSGHAVISFDFSHNGVGADGVDFSALDLFSRATHSRNVDEIRMVLDSITSGPLFPRPPRRVGLLGHSRGGGEAIIATSEDRRVDALVTWAAISTVRRWSAAQIAAWERGDLVFIENSRTSQSMPIGPEYWRDLTENSARLDVISAAQEVRVPWLLAHGDADETVPVDEARRLRYAAGSAAEMFIVPGAGHTFGATHPAGAPHPDLLAVTDATVQWFAKHLASSNPL